ncbi:HSP20-like chaperones superfamily protein isoform 2 [Hibiscus syriacus]|uniref:HSP20-like chaperones superfamily protein isoform 2 n=1 Tax=Hibiscus syriacus TaxID=106335 RepID=A0A6A3D8X4_HIBSY|nr:HSP20-like chaperones superfamily protein isoform 2 [Hibiscus syriacus]
MAIVTEYQEEEEEKPSASPASAAKPVSFTASLDPANPVEFLEKEVAEIVRVAKEKSKKMVEEEAQKVENMKEVKEEKEMKKEVEKEATEVDKKEDVKDEETISGPRVPNKGNGLDLENYSWTQTLEEVAVNVPAFRSELDRSLLCGELYQAVKPDDCYWSTGDPEIDTQKVKPENSELSDLDPETRQTLEKMMVTLSICSFFPSILRLDSFYLPLELSSQFDQKQKAMGLPTSDELRKQELLKKSMSEVNYSLQKLNTSPPCLAVLADGFFQGKAHVNGVASIRAFVLLLFSQALCLQSLACNCL